MDKGKAADYRLRQDVYNDLEAGETPDEIRAKRGDRAGMLASQIGVKSKVGPLMSAVTPPPADDGSGPAQAQGEEGFTGFESNKTPSRYEGSQEQPTTEAPAAVTSTVQPQKRTYTDAVPGTEAKPKRSPATTPHPDKAATDTAAAPAAADTGPPEPSSFEKEVALQKTIARLVAPPGLPPEEKADFERRRQELEGARKEARDYVNNGKMWEQIAIGVGKLAAGIYGATHGVDMSGMQFDKNDWKAEMDSLQQGIDAQVGILNEQRKTRETEIAEGVRSDREIRKDVREADQHKEEMGYKQKVLTEEERKNKETERLKGVEIGAESKRADASLAETKEKEKQRIAEAADKVIRDNATKLSKVVESDRTKLLSALDSAAKAKNDKQRNTFISSAKAIMKSTGMTDADINSLTMEPTFLGGAASALAGVFGIQYSPELKPMSPDDIDQPAATQMAEDARRGTSAQPIASGKQPGSTTTAGGKMVKVTTAGKPPKYMSPEDAAKFKGKPGFEVSE